MACSSIAKQWLVDHRSGLTDVEHSYIQSSIAHASGVQKKASRQRAALLASVLGLLAIAAVGGPFAYGVISERRLIDREAARTDLRGQIVAYATAVVGGTAADRAEGYETSPYTTPLVQRLRQKNKSLIEALADVHQDVIGLTNGAQRPFLSTSMNGHVYLWQQPVSRAKRAVVISVDDIHWRNVPALLAPKYDAQAVVGVLHEAGFKDDEIIKLHNVSRERIDAAIADAIKSFPSRKPNVSGFLPAPHAPGALPVVPTGLVAEPGARFEPNTLLLVFFSGHGMSTDGQNYLLPDLRGRQLRDVRDAEAGAVNVQTLTELVSAHAAASIIILDTHFPPLPRAGPR